MFESVCALLYPEAARSFFLPTTPLGSLACSELPRSLRSESLSLWMSCLFFRDPQFKRTVSQSWMLGVELLVHGALFEFVDFVFNFREIYFMSLKLLLH